MRRRQHQISLYLSDKELDTLNRKRRAGNLSCAAFLRSCILGKEVYAIIPADYAALRREVNAIGNNINQTARAVNAGIATPADIAGLKKQLSQIYTVLERGMPYRDDENQGHQDPTG
ncbi:MobC family plasmid mobilization relaxosome protein [Oscillospiraceae bacterium OttesenSCG-928-G22]|nr:MobC family plasmid mobilization relaxosome protein [Oscillospiraceae bacterium OttesenSCG-928-G22]